MARVNVNDWLTEEGLTKIKGWAMDGLFDEQIAENIGIKRQTLYNWRMKHSDIFDALKVNKDVADRHVENAMFNNAVGFEYEEEMVTNAGEVVTVKKYSKPNVTAQIFWLKNRKKDEWRDKTEQEVEHKGEVSFHDDI